jgi:GNAT superfamily N-acetyltransferase
VAIEVRPLRETDDRASFESGDDQLDLFFRRFAGQNQFRHHIGTTYVAVEGEAILGFATVTVGQIEIEKLPSNLRKRLPNYPLPILRLARLAARRGAQGKGIGHLMRAVFAIAVELRERLGCVGVVVDAKPAAKSYYARYGFVALEVVEGTLDDRPPPSRCSCPYPRSSRRSGLPDRRKNEGPNRP